MAGISLFGYKLPHREAAVVGLTGQRGMDMVNPAVSRPARHEHDLKTLVHRDRNHPSVLMWSIGNEIDYPNDPYCHPSFTTMTGNNDANKPAAERMYNPAKPNMERLAVLAAMLADEVKQEDPTRPVTAAAAFPELSSYLGFLDSLDVVGYNYKEQFYEEDHKRFPEKPFFGSEKRPHHGSMESRAGQREHFRPVPVDRH